MAFAVFFGFTFCGLIYLYVKTRDTWNWRKIVLVAVISLIVALLSLLLLIFWDKLFNPQANITYGKKYSGLIQSYDGLSIGDNISDIEFKLGKLKSEGKTKGGGYDIFRPNDNSPKVIYTVPSGKKVDFIGVDCDKYNEDSFNGIKCGTTSDEIVKKYKNKLKIWCPSSLDKNDDPFRIYDIVEFGTRFYLQKNQVVGIRLLKPDDMKNPSTFKDCDS